MAIETFLGECPPLKFRSDDGHISYVTTDLGDRAHCMEIAMSENLGRYDAVHSIGKTPRTDLFLLQIVRMDNEEMNPRKFASIFMRSYEASKVGCGPKMIDGWMAKCKSGSVFGYLLFDKPDSTLEEYLCGRTSNDDLKSRVVKTVPLIKDMFARIGGSFLNCWPGPSLDTRRVGLYVSEEGDAPLSSFVIDWSSCVLGMPSYERMMGPFADKYVESVTNCTPLSKLEDLKEMMRDLTRAR